MRFANSPPPVIIRQLVPFKELANSIAFFGKRLPPIFITHSIIFTPRNKIIWTKQTNKTHYYNKLNKKHYYNKLNKNS